MTGGPGCSSELALLFENGPYTVTKKTFQKPVLHDNPFSWNKVSNLIFIDQPGGTGFSTVQNPSGYTTDEAQVSADMLQFLYGFYKQYPQYKPLDFFISVRMVLSLQKHVLFDFFSSHRARAMAVRPFLLFSSFSCFFLTFGDAGHYVPATAAAIVQANKQNPPFVIPLRAIAVGNGLIDPLLTTQSYPAFAYAHGLINKDCLNQANALFPQCAQDIANQNYADAFYDCNNVFGQVLQCAGNINYYDIRKQCDPAPLCYDFSGITDYLNEDATRKMLGVGSITWQSCSNRVYTYMENDFEVNFRDDIPLLLSAGVRVTIYEGVEDLICNFYGASATLQTLNWSGQSGFNSAANVTWHVAGSVAGSARTYANLTYVNVLAAGHMVR